jgi:hypothetical protein
MANLMSSGQKRLEAALLGMRSLLLGARRD